MVFKKLQHQNCCILFSLSRKLRVRDATKFHVQLCVAIGLMFTVFVAGIDQTDPFGGCVAVSALIQYFTLVSVMWMGAEAVLMFQKLVIVFAQITTKHIIIVSLTCWCMFLTSLSIYIYVLYNIHTFFSLQWFH